MREAVVFPVPQRRLNEALMLLQSFDDIADGIAYGNETLVRISFVTASTERIGLYTMNSPMRCRERAISSCLIIWSTGSST
jgi:hypothetical protein